jgi:serine/threonine protein kinase
LIKLGKGTFGEVWLGRIKDREENLKTKFSAIKVAINDEAKLRLENEYLTMKAIREVEQHPNVIKYIQFIPNVTRHFNKTMKIVEKSSFLALEFASNRNLLEYVIY